MIQLNQTLQGSILDIGGGGEGVIGRRYGAQVTAIDNRQEELDEAPDGFAKVQMDARRLSYPDGSFDHVTFFFSLMFMDTETQKRAICEAVRVLRRGGSLHIWDAEIAAAAPSPFFADVDVVVNGALLHTTYGVVNDIVNQTAASVCTICAQCGLRQTVCHAADGQFYLAFEKPMEGANC